MGVEIGIKITQLREKEGLTQKELAEMIGSSQQVIQRIEVGRRSPRFEGVEKIVNAMGYKIDFIKKQ